MPVSVFGPRSRKGTSREERSPAAAEIGFQAGREVVGGERVKQSIAGEPLEWFKGRHFVTLSFRDPDWVMHKLSKRCKLESPHLMDKCGEFIRRPSSSVPRGIHPA